MVVDPTTMSTQTETMQSGATADDTAFGLAANIAAAVGYVIPILGLVFLFVEDDNEFLRFSAAQSVAFSFGLFIVRFGLSITLGLLPGAIAGLAGLVISLFSLGIFAVMLFLAYKAFNEETVELPVFAGIARSIEQAL